MQWRECAAFMEKWGDYSRFEWPLASGPRGFDCDPLVATTNDVVGAIGWILTWPGDYLFSIPAVQAVLMAPARTEIGSGWSWALMAFGTLLLVDRLRRT